MPRSPGRDQSAAMERLVRIVAVLSEAGKDGVPIDHLVGVGQYGAGDIADQRTQLQRDIKVLAGVGLRITNQTPAGESARYVLQAVDNRLTVRLTPAQLAALQRAAIAVDRAELARPLGLSVSDPPSQPGPVIKPAAPLPYMDLVVSGVQRLCRIRFDYKSRPRVVHGQAVTPQDGNWYLTGREDGSEITKHFSIARMTNVELDPPGTAQPAQVQERPALDPLQWEVDKPIDITTSCAREHRPDVERLLGPPATVTEHDGQLRLTHRVTHRLAFRHRVYELGTRVRVLGPPDFLDELGSALKQVASR